MKKNNFFYKFIKSLLIRPMRIFFPYEIKGESNFKKLDGAYILCSNHLSNIDPVFLIISNKREIHFMAKAELFKNRFLKWIFLNLGAFAVERGKGDKKAISVAQDILNDDGVLGIFIEGTRSKTGEFLRPKSGSVLIAYNSKVPIVPVCITGGGKNNKIRLFKKTVISFGEPIYLYENFETGAINTNILRSFSKIVMGAIKGMR